MVSDNMYPPRIRDRRTEDSLGIHRINDICWTADTRRGRTGRSGKHPEHPKATEKLRVVRLIDCGVPLIRAVRVHFTASRHVTLFHMAWSDSTGHHSPYSSAFAAIELKQPKGFTRRSKRSMLNVSTCRIHVHGSVPITPSVNKFFCQLWNEESQTINHSESRNRGRSHV